jgi:hypothetical protein
MMIQQNYCIHTCLVLYGYCYSSMHGLASTGLHVLSPINRPFNAHLSIANPHSLLLLPP